MKAIKWGLAALVAASGAASIASAEEVTPKRGAYVTGSLGILAPTDQTVYEDAWEELEVQWASGPYLSIAGGYGFDNGFRAELELAHTSFESDAVKASFGGMSVKESFDGIEASATFVTVGGFYDFRPSARFSPYVGAGLGIASWELEYEDAEEDGTDFTMFGEAGLNVALNANATLAPSYRFQWINNGENGVEDSKAHVFKLGLRYTF